MKGVQELPVIDVGDHLANCLGDRRPPGDDEEAVVALHRILDLVPSDARFIQQGYKVLKILTHLSVDDEVAVVAGVLTDGEVTVFAENPH
jgi:hypothetical protein